MRYDPSYRYRILAVVSLLMALLFGYRITLNDLTAEPGALFFLLIMLGVSLWTLRILVSRVELTGDAVTYIVAGRTTCEVKNRQLVDVIEGGRVIRSLTLLYHPLCADGLVNVDAIQSLNLPGVEGMDGFIEQLQSRVPT